jgi:hypothetical protein
MENMSKISPQRTFAHLALAIACWLSLGSGLGANVAPLQKEAPEDEEKQPAPVMITAQFLAQAKNPKIPWQFYAHYADIYEGFANQIRVLIGPKTPKTQAQRLREAVKFYQGLAERIRAMGELKKTLDGIRHQKTDIPPMRWGETYKATKWAHREQLAEFERVTRMLPFKGTLPSTPTSDRRK